MEKRLPESELENLVGQYYELTETITQYRRLMRTRRFRCGKPEDQRITKIQYGFFRSAIDDNLRVLLDHGVADKEMLSHAVWNRSLGIKMRWTALNELWKTRTIA